MKIYTVKEFNAGTCEYFVNLNAVAEYLKSKSPIDDKFNKNNDAACNKRCEYDTAS